MKRFYKQASFAEGPEGWRVLLDGRAIKTVGGRPQALPSAALAQAMALEWAEQDEDIDTTRFIYRDMADYALDMVAQDPSEAIIGLIPYAETDTLCYRADPDEALFEKQQQVWEPVLTKAETRLGLRFERISGIIHRPQPAATLAALRAQLEASDPFRLAALRNLSSLAASLAIALEALEPDADVEDLWAAACLEEEWQADLWGRDWEAEERREKRAKAFAATVKFARLAAQVTA
jgi:chaperone required for assembly of F1-ATPase